MSLNSPQPQVKKEPAVKEEPGTSQSEIWQTIPLKSSGPEDFDEHVRIHVMKLASKNDVDIVSDFEKPVRLHRKDPRNMQYHLTRQELDQRKREKEEAEKKRLEEEEAKEEAGGETVKSNGKESSENSTTNAGSKDKAFPEQPKYNKNQADMSQVAPDGGARKSKKNLFKRKTRQVNLMDEGKRKLRYEEHYPWVIEDYTGKNVYVGNYEAGSTESSHVLFVFDKDGFKMIPAEKVYRFTPRNKYATLTLEEAEAKMEKNSSSPRWLMKHMENESIASGSYDQRFRNNSLSANGRVISEAGGGQQQRRRMRTVLGGGDASVANDRDSDHDDLDFEEEFADDEEAPIMDGDEEENKMSEKKIKKEMLKAAHLNAEDDADVDDDLDDLFETEKSRKVDKEGKKLMKVLNKREGGIYDSDDEDRELLPYLSKSDLESEEDSENEVQVKKEKTEDGNSTEPTMTTTTTTTTNATTANRSFGRQISATYLGDGFVVVTAPKEFLSTLPPGDWSPSIRKRPSPDIASPKKKIKLEDGNNTIVKIKKEASPVSSTPGSPLGQTGAGEEFDLNDAGPDNLLVTVKDVLDIVKDQPLTTKELLVGLKIRVNAHPNNKQRIIRIVKQNLKLVDGKLALRE
ncbi:TFG1 [Candida oxycetoniae]|uniref:Transcription initiation factor IIF subunit alpha n=1 Tax=Candida oxycetoniae TaxID=497107 RepID=A0AAI9WW05_9ASCO|nr:TFG1 [Candida oxycetoniae]KAI3402725.2 TFG1 [Candida oxycetoniae]